MRGENKRAGRGEKGKKKRHIWVFLSFHINLKKAMVHSNSGVKITTQISFSVTTPHLSWSIKSPKIYIHSVEPGDVVGHKTNMEILIAHELIHSWCVTSNLDIRNLFLGIYWDSRGCGWSWMIFPSSCCCNHEGQDSRVVMI